MSTFAASMYDCIPGNCYKDGFVHLSTQAPPKGWPRQHGHLERETTPRSSRLGHIPLPTLCKSPFVASKLSRNENLWLNCAWAALHSEEFQAWRTYLFFVGTEQLVMITRFQLAGRFPRRHRRMEKEQLSWSAIRLESIQSGLHNWPQNWVRLHISSKQLWNLRQHSKMPSE